VAEAPRSWSTLVTADQATVAGTEKVVATLSGVTPRRADSVIRLLGVVYATGAAGTTTLTLRVRRDGLTGAVVGEASVVALSGAVQGEASIQVEDAGRGEGSFTYVLTATIAGAAATVNSAALQALAT
jgi:hypothetical protein